MSHYEMYLNAVESIESSTNRVKSLLSNWDNELSFDINISNQELPLFVSNFLKFTFQVIELNKAHITASVFTL
jgi:hypothetical protein